jgi:hypothetical protein
MVNVDSSWNYISMIEQPLFYYQIIDRNFSIEKMWKNIVSISPSGLIKEELYDLMGDPDERMGFQWQSSISR